MSSKYNSKWNFYTIINIIVIEDKIISIVESFVSEKSRHLYIFFFFTDDDVQKYILDDYHI